MRCKNCGWDNLGNNAKCVKCNAPLSGSMVDNRDEGKANSDSDGFNPKKTSRENLYPKQPSGDGNICPNCSYPIREGEKNCPNCGFSLTEKPGPEEKIGGTVIVDTTRTKFETARKLVGFLVTYDTLPDGEAFKIYEGRNYIGRDSSVVDICIQGDMQISGRHLSILYRTVDKKFKFKDEQSSNGTFVNGLLTDEGELKNFDLISIGKTKLRFIVIPQ